MAQVEGTMGQVLMYLQQLTMNQASTTPVPIEEDNSDPWDPVMPSSPSNPPDV